MVVVLPWVRVLCNPHIPRKMLFVAATLIVTPTLLLRSYINRQGSHGHDITGKVLKLENKISSTGKVLEWSKSWSRSWKVLEFFGYALFLAIDFVKNKIKNIQDM